MEGFWLYFTTFSIVVGAVLGTFLLVYSFFTMGFGVFDHLFGTEIHVTQKDIENGKRGCQSSCAIALALNRELRKKYPDNKDVSSSVTNYGGFHIGLFYGWKNNRWGEDNQIWKSTYVHPRFGHIKEFVRNFDAGCDVKPFKFKIIL